MKRFILILVAVSSSACFVQSPNVARPCKEGLCPEGYQCVVAENVCVPQGVSGPEGSRGDPGPRGDTGAQGPVGVTGPQGPEGAQGPQGLRGPEGSQGPAGPQGLTGPQGLAGARGPEGLQGAMGLQGPAGPQGLAGPGTATWDKALPVSERFVLVLSGEAVLDKETGLVWQKQINPAMYTYAVSLDRCLQMKAGNRRGWRLPRAEELVSLLADANDLPADHPFQGYSAGPYWTQTQFSYEGNDYIFVVTPQKDYVVAWAFANQSFKVWCVRGG